MILATCFKTETDLLLFKFSTFFSISPALQQCRNVDATILGTKPSFPFRPRFCYTFILDTHFKNNHLVYWKFALVLFIREIGIQFVCFRTLTCYFRYNIPSCTYFIFRVFLLNICLAFFNTIFKILQYSDNNSINSLLLLLKYIAFSIDIFISFVIHTFGFFLPLKVSS